MEPAPARLHPVNRSALLVRLEQPNAGHGAAGLPSPLPPRKIPESFQAATCKAAPNTELLLRATIPLGTLPGAGKPPSRASPGAGGEEESDRAPWRKTPHRTALKRVISRKEGSGGEEQGRSRGWGTGARSLVASPSSQAHSCSPPLWARRLHQEPDQGQGLPALEGAKARQEPPALPWQPGGEGGSTFPGEALRRGWNTSPTAGFGQRQLCPCPARQSRPEKLLQWRAGRPLSPLKNLCATVRCRRRSTSSQRSSESPRLALTQLEGASSS